MKSSDNGSGDDMYGLGETDKLFETLPKIAFILI